MWKQKSLSRCCSAGGRKTTRLTSAAVRRHTPHVSLSSGTSQFKNPPPDQPWRRPHELHLFCVNVKVLISESDTLHLFIMLQLLIPQHDFGCCCEQDYVVWNKGSLDFKGQVASVSLPRTRNSPEETFGVKSFCEFNNATQSELEAEEAVPWSPEQLQRVIAG